jgi:predicted ATPase
MDRGVADSEAPELLVLNEPETSLHPDLLGPLGQLISDASERTQVIVVTHSDRLIDALSATTSAGERPQMIELIKQYDETHLKGQGRLDEPPWKSPSR